MLNLGLLAFASPWMLLALAALPVIWWLLRVTPPSPRRVLFPAVRLLMRLRQTDETPARTPWWLLALRLVLAALVILALAEPLLNPGARLVGSGPLLVIVDDGWAAARRWPARIETLGDIVDQAGRDGRPVALMTTAVGPGSAAASVSGLMAAGDARELVENLEPKPWTVTRDTGALDAARLPVPSEVVWLSDGLAHDGEAATAFAQALARLGPSTILIDEPAELAQVLAPPVSAGSQIDITVKLAEPVNELTAPVWLRASADNGQILAREPFILAEGARGGTLTLNLPAEARNLLTRLELEGGNSAAAVFLLDERWRRRPVGLVSGGPLERAQPLLSEVFYLGRALEPFSEIRAGNVAGLLRNELAVLVLADIGQVQAADRAALVAWLNDGGVLVRFAGPRMAENSDDLIPVRLRSGTRTLGGALTWTTPARLGQFDEASLFFGLTVPGDVLVERQVLAEPSIDLAAKTWARLEDGTPLVTAERRGDGWIVLFHVTANAAWSNLPISGLFVDMLRRIVGLSQGVAAAAGEVPLPALATLDGFGRLGAPPPGVRPVSAVSIDTAEIGPDHPPGYYGTLEDRRALNLSPSLVAPERLTDLPGTLGIGAYATSAEVRLLAWLLVAALGLLFADMLAVLALRGQMRWRVTGSGIAAGAFVLAIAIAAAPHPALAQADDAFAILATRDTHLAYVITGDPGLDETSRAGLAGLSRVLTLRTAIEPAAPIGVDPESDELAFFAILYWPIGTGQGDLSDRALANIDRFMKNGGTIVFDTRDQQEVGFDPLSGDRGIAKDGPGARRLSQILAGLDIPPLEPVPEDHVLTKAFYLLHDFPGRWSGGTVWVERHAGGTNDGVSSIIIGANDWAAAWAADDEGRPFAAVVPGGARQREMAYRFGVNLVMYAFTGNYKADQVHVPAILERLGQ